MTVTCRDVVTRAIRKLSRVAAGTEPNANDMKDGLEEFQALLLELAGQGMFGVLYDVVVTDATYTAFPQQRIACNRQGGVAVDLPQFVDPAAWPSGNWWLLGAGYYDYQFRDYYCGTTPLPPHDGACIQINDQFSSLRQTWVYQSSAARWIMLNALNLGDEAPLADQYKTALASMVAVRLASEYGMSVPPQVAKDASLGAYAITHRNDGVRGTTYAEYF